MGSSKAAARLMLERFEKIKSDRSQWHSHWQDLKDLVRPHTSGVDRKITKGERLTRNIYDGTATWALNQFAAALHAFLTSPTSRWFTLSVQGVPAERLDLQARAWLEMVSDIIYTEYSNPNVHFNSNLNECYLDIGAFGTCSLYQAWNQEKKCLKFRAFPLSDTYILENDCGEVDTVIRSVCWSTRQVMQFLNGLPMPPKFKQTVDRDKQRDKQWTILHMVFPRKDRDFLNFMSVNKPYASVWAIHDTKEILKESGYDEMAYHTPRWTKLAGEVYGRSPAMSCLPEIKMVNAMMKTTIKAAQKIVDPPLQVPNDGFMLPLKTDPGSLVFHEPGIDRVEPLLTNGNIPIGIEMMEQSRDQIMKAFFIDLIFRQKKKERQTTTEIVDDREEMLRQMSPMLGRLQGELLGPMLRRSYRLLARAGRIPVAPPSLQGASLDVTYISPAARAQEGIKVNDIQVYLNDIAAIAQFSPEVVDVINTDVAAGEIARLRAVTPKILRDQEEVSGIREGRAQQEEALQGAQQGKLVAGAVKDLSVADKNRRSI